MSTKAVNQTENGAKAPVKKKSFDEVWALPIVKRIVNIVYSLGASVVIIGAMFKILHLPGASVILGVGMITEAFLFALSIFDAPHVDYHWDHVFPALTAKEPNPMDYSGKLGGNGGGGFAGGIINNGGATLTGNISITEKLPEADAKALTESIKNMSETAAQLADISRVAGLTDSYANNLSKAAEAAGIFAEKQQKLDEASNVLLESYAGIAVNMSDATTNTRSFADKADELSKNLSSINTAYELQLNGLNAQAAAIEKQNLKINQVTEGFEKLQESVVSSVSNMDAYRDMTSQLAKNVSELNNVYGNMLSAIKA